MKKRLNRSRITCPLCRNDNITIKEKFNRNQIIAGWVKRFGYDVSEDIKGSTIIIRLNCNTCGLGFFNPMPMASKELYAHLANEPWYYEKNKWEYYEAVQDTATCRTLLEIGSGRGEFIAQLQARGIKGIGLEINEKAKNEAQSLGRAVYDQNIEDISEQFDVVCCFQVLEHLADPERFIKLALSKVKPGGLFIIAVPNNDSYIKYERNLINCPPHHVTRWNTRSLRFLTCLFPLSIERISYEPITSERFHLVTDAYCSALPNIPGFIGVIYRISRWLLLPVIRNF